MKIILFPSGNRPFFFWKYFLPQTTKESLQVKDKEKCISKYRFNIFAILGIQGAKGKFGQTNIYQQVIHNIFYVLPQKSVFSNFTTVVGKRINNDDCIANSYSMPSTILFAPHSNPLR